MHYTPIGGYAKPDAPQDESAKPEPVYSIDMIGTNVIATSGIDENMPPKGSVRVGSTHSSSYIHGHP
jgi:hypothetical protein